MLFTTRKGSYDDTRIGASISLYLKGLQTRVLIPILKYGYTLYTPAMPPTAAALFLQP